MFNFLENLYLRIDNVELAHWTLMGRWLHLGMDSREGGNRTRMVEQKVEEASVHCPLLSVTGYLICSLFVIIM